MTKRFIYDGLHIRDLHCKIPPILTNNDKIRDKYLNELNELHEENQQLKHDLEIYEENNTNEVLNQLRIELTSRVNDCIEEFKG